MGAWGTKTFENDTALDWLAEFESEGADALADTFQAVTDADSTDDIDADDACCALAAAEIIAAMKTSDETRLAEEARAALANYRDDIDLDHNAPLAARAATRVKTNSELHDLWEETDDYDDWISDVEALIDRLR